MDLFLYYFFFACIPADRKLIALFWLVQLHFE